MQKSQYQHMIMQRSEVTLGAQPDGPRKTLGASAMSISHGTVGASGMAASQLKAVDATFDRFCDNLL